MVVQSYIWQWLKTRLSMCEFLLTKAKQVSQAILEEPHKIMCNSIGDLPE